MHFSELSDSSRLSYKEGTFRKPLQFQWNVNMCENKRRIFYQSTNEHWERNRLRIV